MQTRFIWTLLALGLCFTTHAREVGVRVGYFKGNSFQGTTKKLTLEGPMLGLDLPLLKAPLGLVDLRFSPTLILAGATRKGADSDATVLRFELTAKVKPPLVGLYGIAGLGYGSANGRGGTTFDKRNGVVARIGVGSSLSGGVPLPIQPNIEVNYHMGNAAFRGLSFEASVKF